jgi:TRAP-type C4-dicarboxylate transport system permease small subunit
MAKNKKINQKTIIVGLTIALIFVLLGVFVFSYAMETLDKQAEALGAEEQPVYQPPFPDYNIPGLDNEWSALIIGIAGTMLLFVVSLGIAKILRKKKS